MCVCTLTDIILVTLSLSLTHIHHKAKDALENGGSAMCDCLSQ